jgi:hypothetical protein
MTARSSDSVGLRAKTLHFTPAAAEPARPALGHRSRRPRLPDEPFATPQMREAPDARGHGARTRKCGAGGSAGVQPAAGVMAGGTATVTSQPPTLPWNTNMVTSA